MIIVPKQEIDPKWYSYSKLKPEPNPDLSKVRDRISIFDRNSVLLMCAAVSWYAWVSPRESHYDDILDINSMFLAALGAGVCKKEGQETINEPSFRILAGDIFNATDLSRTENVNEEELNIAIDHYIAQHPELAQLKSIESMSLLKIITTFGRLATVQSEGRSFMIGDMFRPYAIYMQFREIAIESKKCSAVELERAENIFLGTTVERFIKAIWFLFTIHIQSTTKEKPVPNPIIFGKEIINEDIKKQFDLNTEDFYKAITRFTVTTSEITENISRIDFEKSSNWIHFPEIWLLRNNPIVRFDDDVEERFLILSPSRLLRRLVTFFLWDIYEYLDQNQILKSGRQARDFRGLAYETYLRQIFNRTEVKDVDDLLPDQHSDGKCDFIWEGRNHTILIEAKARIRPNNDKTFANSRSFITSVATCLTALKQGVQTRKDLKMRKPTVLVIATEEALADVSSQFVKLAKRFNWLNKTGISGIAVLHTSEVEYMVRNLTPEQVYLSVVGSWYKTVPASMSLSDHDSAFFKSKNKWDMHPYLLQFSEKIFPGFNEALEDSNFETE